MIFRNSPNSSATYGWVKIQPTKYTVDAPQCSFVPIPRLALAEPKGGVKMLKIVRHTSNKKIPTVVANETLYPNNKIRLYVSGVTGHSLFWLGSTSPGLIYAQCVRSNKSSGSISPEDQATITARGFGTMTDFIQNTLLAEYSIDLHAAPICLAKQKGPITITAVAISTGKELEYAQILVTFGTQLELPDEDTDEGMMARLFVVEAHPLSDDGLKDAIASVALMKQVIADRQAAISDPKYPKNYFNTNDPKISSIIMAHNQFAGFEHYPLLANKQKANLDGINRTANDGNVDSAERDRTFIDAAIQTSKSKTTAAAWPNGIYWWRPDDTVPSKDAEFFKELGGNKFYKKKK